MTIMYSNKRDVFKMNNKDMRTITLKSILKEQKQYLRSNNKDNKTAF